MQYTVAGTAIAGTDYVSLSGAVTIEVGSSSALVVVTPIDDTAFESNETVVLTLTADAAYGLGSPNVGTVTIVSDDLPPDLVVSSMSAPSTAGADADIVVTDTTRNQGTGSSPLSNTGFYLSTNTTWDAADVWLGSRQLAALGPGATNVLPTTLHVPPSTATGSYHVLAKADWDGVVTEGNEANNVRASGTVKIGPDLIIAAITAPSSAVAGGTIDVSDTTKNQGGGLASGSTTRFYWSANTSIDASDQIIGVRSVPPLAAGASSTSHLDAGGSGWSGRRDVLRHCPGRRRRRRAGNDGEQQRQGECGREGRPRSDRERDLDPGHRGCRRDDRRDRDDEESGSGRVDGVVNRILPVREFDAQGRRRVHRQPHGR